MPGPAARIVAGLGRASNALFFLGGALFDWLTVQRIDSWVDIGVEAGYLLLLSALLLLQHRAEHGLWRPGGRAARLWRHNVAAMHFLYGGFLSVNLVFYFRSVSTARPAVFIVLLIALMIANELPHGRAVAHRLRLAPYAFCVATLLAYVVPLLVGRIGDLVFLASTAIAGLLVWGMAGLLARCEPLTRGARHALFRPAGAVLALLVVCYFLRLIPPVPLSVQAHGIYYDVRHEEDRYLLFTTPPPVHAPWRKDARPFRARPGDRLFYFVRVFAPRGFHLDVVLEWERWDEAGHTWMTTDRVPLTVRGGREQGYRGYAVKTRYEPGHWRVSTATVDGRRIGVLAFDVIADRGTGARRFIVRTM